MRRNECLAREQIFNYTRQIGGKSRDLENGNVKMTSDPLSKLESTIAASARQRDSRDQQNRDELTTKERQRSEERAIWSARKNELPGIVKAVDGMLKGHGYGGLAVGVLDLKHVDIDRVVIEFEHSPRTHSKILMCVTRTGDFTCTIAAVSGEVHATTMPIKDLTTETLKETLAQAVTECLSGAWAPRSERSPQTVEAVRQ